MCGILAAWYSDTKANESVVLEGLKQIDHRGPDGFGTFLDQNVALGHARLSIIDVSGGHQPMNTSNERYYITFNGEIYNYIELKNDLLNKGYIFNNNSDTEVLLYLYVEYGQDCLKMLNGIYAFIIYDKQERSFFGARDHLGIKPLYYIKNNGAFFAASEIKVLRKLTQVSNDIDLRALELWMSYRHVPSPHTLFKQIKKLEPGHFFFFKEDVFEIHRFFKNIPHIQNVSFSAILKEYQEKLEEAIVRQMVSDVPIGVMLSGGVDSGIVAKVAADHSESKIRTYTVGFEEAGEHNELSDARLTANYAGTDHNEIILSNKEYIDFFHKSFHYLEEPIATASASAFYYVSKLASKDVKVLLTGQGADEPLGGYKRHLGVKYSGLINSLLKMPLIGQYLRNKPNESIRRASDSLRFNDELEKLTNVFSIIGPELKSQLLLNDIKSECLPYQTQGVIEDWFNEVSHLDELNRMLYIDTRSGLPDDLLLYGDKMSMAASIEVRVPFLDTDLLHFMETIPSKYKIKWFKTKYLHKIAASKWLPNEVINRKKKGFYTPIDTWFKQNIGSEVRDMIVGPNSAVSKFFDTNVLSKLFDDHKNGVGDYQRILFAYWSFELWYQSMVKGE